MFSPGTKRRSTSSRSREAAPPDSPISPAVGNRVPNRPSTGTPAPWAPRLSVLARIPATKDDKGSEVDQTKPVFVGEFPQKVREKQMILPQKRAHGDMYVSGGMDQGTSLSWIICGDRIFIWNYLSSAASKDCTDLQIPSHLLEVEGSGKKYQGSRWLLRFVNWDNKSYQIGKSVRQCKSIGLFMCDKRTLSVTYWPDIYSDRETDPVTIHVADNDLDAVSSPTNQKTTPRSTGPGSSFSETHIFNSLIVSAIPGCIGECVALACGSNSELWQFRGFPHEINKRKVNETFSRGYPRALTWRFPFLSEKEARRQFFLLTDHEIQCFSLNFASDLDMSKLWSHKIISDDGELGIRKDLAGQKQIWPLDMQVDGSGKVITILVAILCMDRNIGSSYTQYYLLTMQYKSGLSISPEVRNPKHESVLEKKAPFQVIIPKARVEDEDFLFSMRLRIGGRPSGSVIILCGDGTATVSHYYSSSTRLYQFDLPYDAGKVLDASVLPSADDFEEGAWVVITEKAGIWAIPEKAVVLGGVEPPERSLSRKGSSNGRSTTQEERRRVTFSEDIAPRKASSESLSSGDRQKPSLTGIARRTAQDEESETLLNHLFHDFLLSASGQVDDSLGKLKNVGAFEREGETNVFARTSKSIVDTLAKHWTTTRGAEIVSMGVVSTQLLDKQQKHQKFLQFLALSKCHEELCSRQINALLTILEHGEKLAGMIKLRELQNIISQNRSAGVEPQYFGSDSKSMGALWELIQLVGERARHNTVLLMDRDNAEVFYSKVSNLEDVFYCLEKQMDYLVSVEQPLRVQVQRSFELSNACVALVRTAINYRNEYHLWYPPPEGLAPWYCQPLVRRGLWSIAAFMLQLLNDATGLEIFAKLEICTHLEVLTEVLLEAYTGAITAKVEREEQERGLLEEYWQRRDTLLNALYQQTKNMELDEESGELKVYQELSTRLLAIAKQHEGYSTLWSICCDLNDTVLLKTLMRESMGPRGGFSYFVFEQLYLKRQFSKILRLGEEFPVELSIFLKHHSDLLWLHEVYLHQFPSAAETLHGIALYQEEASRSEAEEEADSDCSGLTLAERKRFLNLAKIAALAANDEDTASKMKRIEADLKILKLQEEVTKLLDTESKQSVGNRLLRPEDLITLCLESNKSSLTLRAFDIFASTSSFFVKRHRSLLEECWRNAADQDDWWELYRAFTAEGWSDEETMQVLKESVLFQAAAAASRCYGTEAEVYEEEGMDEVLPLRQENSSGLKDVDDSSSVEAILMQHRYFPDAGKLMLMAIELGGDRVSAGGLEDGHLPIME